MPGSNSPSGNVMPQSTISHGAHPAGRARRGRRSCRSRRDRRAPRTRARRRLCPGLRQALLRSSTFVVSLCFAVATSARLTSPNVKRRSRPSAPAISSAPSSSRPTKRPSTRPSLACTASGSPSAPARSSQAARTRANPAPSFHVLSQASMVSARKHNASCGERAKPCAARYVAARPEVGRRRGEVKADADDRRIRRSAPASVLSTRMPPVLAEPIRMSFGHLRRRPPAPGEPALRMASIAATPATSESWPALAMRARRRDSRLACRLPGSDAQARPERPRPAVWRSASTHSGPRSPASARRMASALVESVSARWIEPIGRGQSGAGGLMGRGRRDCSDCAAASAASTSGAGRSNEQQHEQRRDRHDEAGAALDRQERLARVVEEHDLDDPQVVVGGNHARQHADDGERIEPRLDRGGEHVELGEEAGERRHAGHREQDHGQHEGHGQVGLGEARQARRCPRPCRALSRMDRMQAKAPTVMNR